MDDLFERQWDHVEAGRDSVEDFGRKGSQQMVRRGGRSAERSRLAIALSLLCPRCGGIVQKRLSQAKLYPIRARQTVDP